MAEQYGLLFDARRCIGCRTCVIACKTENRIAQGSWLRLLNHDGTTTDVPAGQYPRLSLSWEVHACRHCKNPPCLRACPSEGAIYQRPDGIVLMDRDKCTGCRACGDACPYEAIRFHPGDGRAEKCTLCSHRIDQGLEPFCVKECIWGALRFTNREGPENQS
jgi:Fe-S-cluster-containing dehydrogenase component